MIDILVAGGLTFTIPLTILAVSVLVLGGLGTVSILREGNDAAFWTRMLFHVGLFAFVLGIFSQGVGLYQAMSAIEAAGGVSPEMVMGGLKVSMIAPLYGLTIFLVAMVIRSGLDIAARQVASESPA